MIKKTKEILLKTGRSLQGDGDKNNGYEWTRNGRSFRCLKPLVKKNTFLNKSGLVSFSAELQSGKKVKIYECVSAEQAKFIREITSSPEMSKHFPTVYFLENCFLVCEWMEGEALTWKKIFSSIEIIDSIVRQRWLFRIQ